MWGICLEPIIAIEPVAKEEIVVRHGKKGAMLVNIIKLVDSPERLVAALVWFDVINSFYRQWPHALYFSSLFGFVSSEVLRNREFDTSTGFFAGADNDKLISQMVESTSEIVNDVPCRCDRIEGQPWKNHEPPRCLPGLSVQLGANYCRADIPRSEKVGCETTEVLFGPLNFNADKNDSVVCG